MNLGEMNQMSNSNNDTNAALYLLAGVGLGAIIGVAAGMLFAPKAGEELRQDLGDKVKDLKGKADSWVTEQRTKRAATEAEEQLGV